MKASKAMDKIKNKYPTITGISINIKIKNNPITIRQRQVNST